MTDQSCQPARERIRESRQRSHRSLAEWITLAISALIVAALIGAALVEHFWLDEVQGVALDVTLDQGQTRQVDDLYHLPFAVKNAGSEGAENVTIAFAVRDGEQTMEESTIVIDFLSNGGTASGELVTAYDPSAYDISARVSAFETP